MGIHDEASCKSPTDHIGIPEITLQLLLGTTCSFSDVCKQWWLDGLEKCDHCSSLGGGCVSGRHGPYSSCSRYAPGYCLLDGPPFFRGGACPSCCPKTATRNPSGNRHCPNNISILIHHLIRCLRCLHLRAHAISHCDCDSTWILQSDGAP